jgi:predicted RNA-binding protein associated with RNAse of E/G family
MPSDFPDVATYRDILLGSISDTCLIDGASEVPASMRVKLCGQAWLGIHNNYKMLKYN